MSLYKEKLIKAYSVDELVKKRYQIHPEVRRKNLDYIWSSFAIK